MLIAAGSVLLVILLWGAMAIELRTERSTVIESAIRENRNRAAALEQFVIRTLETANLAAMHLAEDHSVPAPRSDGARPAALADPVAANPLFAAVIITDAEGRVRSATSPASVPTDLSGRADFQHFRDSPEDKGVMISPPEEVRPGEKPVLSLARGIRTSDGRFGGIVIVAFAGERLVDFNRGATTRPLDLISTIRLDGISLVRREGQRVTFGEDLRGTRVMREQLANPNGTYVGPSALDGFVRYFSHQRLSEYGVFVTVGVGEADVLAGSRSRASFVTWGMVVLTLAIFGLAWSIVAGMYRRETAALALDDANQRLREAQRIARIGDWAYDPATGTVHWSEQLCALNGRDPARPRLTPDELAGCYGEPGLRAWRAALDRAIATGEIQECEIEIVHADESVDHRRLKMEPRLGPDGKVAEIVGTEQDITREKAHDQLRDHIAHFARVESMNALAVTVAHELAQPLTAASNYLASARTRAGRGDAAEGPGIVEALDRAEQQIGLTRTIIRRVWEMIGRRRAGKMRASLPAAVRDAVALVKLANENSHVEIVERLDPEARFVAGDKVQIQQVIANLLRNAAEAAADSEQPQVVVSSWRMDGAIAVRVADNGPGLANAPGDIFSAFASTKSAGLGLGLSISRMIIDSFGGSIWAEAPEAPGARICFSLPAYSDAA